MGNVKIHWYKFYFLNEISPVVIALSNDMEEIVRLLQSDMVLWVRGSDQYPSAAICMKYVVYAVEVDGDEK
ncbi:hypothetical protein [Companilactobacillus jidongensis]|uniref:hypothetical protein n=1 Tax=Companilactobacillus jidongensis TaxID=2486006 RepID=UPI000F78670B|nr:hypothetical protein [Companilactobacillus jidongensis]